MFRKTGLCLHIFSLLLAFQTHAVSSMAIMGDAGQAGASLNRLRSSVAKAKVQSIIMPGDNLYFGTYPATWNIWKEQGFKFDVVAIGNHNQSYAEEVRYFSLPGEYYTTVKNGARFFVLNSDNTRNVEEQFKWLNEQIVNVTEKMTFLVFHHPTFTLTSLHSWKEKRNFQLHMREFLRLHGQKISALLLGHDHVSTLVDFGDIPAIVAGSGREVRSASPVDFSEEGFRVKTRHLAEQTQHWVRLDIDDASEEAWIHFVRVSDGKMTCSIHLLSEGKPRKEGCL
jgi:hypothetical protein